MKISTTRFCRAQKSYHHQNSRDETRDRLLLKSVKFFVISPQEPCLPAPNRIRNLVFIKKKQIFRISSSSETLSSSNFDRYKLISIAFEIYNFFCHTSSQTMFSSSILDQKPWFRASKISYLQISTQRAVRHQ